MKEYYKIFGLEEGASIEEVTTRYMELKKQLISAVEKRQKMDITFEEINEAYRKIKKSRTPMIAQFDLDELLKKQYQARMAESRKAKVKRIILTSGVVAVCLIVGAVIFILERPQAPRPWPTSQEGPEQKTRRSLEENARPSALEAKKPARIPEGIPKEPDKSAALETAKPGAKEAERIETAKLSTEQPTGISVTEPEKMKGKEEPLTSPALKPVPPPEAAKAARQEPMKSVLREESKSVAGKIGGIEAAKSIPRGEEVKIKEGVPTPSASRTAPATEAAKVIPQEAGKTGGAESAKISEQKREGEQIASLSVPPLAIASDEEVRRFFDEYLIRYNRQEINGLLSFFSAKAIQNQKDDIRRIKATYETFFEQMESIRYRININQIEPKPDRVEVKAQYELEGIVAKGRRAQNWKGQIRWVLIRENGALKIISLDYQPQPSK
jgi:hypothetical protein